MRLAYFLIGAGVGAPTRYIIDRYFRDNFSFPYGVLVVNVLGSFLLGLTVAETTNISYALIGFCGALTTWSALALDLFIDRTNLRRFSVNLLGNYILGVLAALIGLWVAR